MFNWLKTSLFTFICVCVLWIYYTGILIELNIFSFANHNIFVLYISFSEVKNLFQFPCMLYCSYMVLLHQGHLLFVLSPTSLRPCIVCTRPYLTKAMYCSYLAIPPPRPCTIRTRPYLTKAMYYSYSTITFHTWPQLISLNIST